MHLIIIIILLLLLLLLLLLTIIIITVIIAKTHIGNFLLPNGIMVVSANIISNRIQACFKYFTNLVYMCLVIQ